MTFIPSAQQANFFNWITTGTGSCVLEAVAGSGKTTTLIEALKLMEGTIFFGAYNKKIAEEIKAKAPNKSGLNISTIHAAGLNAWKKVAPKAQIDANKCRVIYRANFKDPEFFKLEGAVLNLVSYAKQAAVGAVCSAADDSVWYELVNHFNIDTLEQDELVVDTAKKLLTYSIAEDTKTIDFDDMIFCPLIHKVKATEYDWVLIDEAQDTNASRRALSLLMLKTGGRLIAVGDRCQPLGTKVSVVKSKGNRWNDAYIEEINIEDLKIGDKVVSYRPRDVSWLPAGKTITGITRRCYNGKLIKILTSDNKTSRYTPNHFCYVNFNNLRNMWAVYIMKKGNQYRIGKCKMDYKNSSGVSARMHCEKAESAWILELYKTEHEAYYWEQAISGKFGLPQLMFSSSKCVRETSNENLPKIWEFIGDNVINGENCLRNFNRYPEYPLFSTNTGKQQTIKRPFITYASNLMNGVSVLPFSYKSNNVHTTKNDWVPITVSYENYNDDVVSLTVEDTHLYVADGILTRNCQAIYGFTGADADSLDLIGEAVNAIQMPLTVTYRCPKNVVTEARKYVSHITAHESAIEGSVAPFHYENLVASVKAGDAILCRFNAPIVELVYKFIAQGIAAKVEGREVGAAMKTLAKRYKSKTYSTLIERIEAYGERESAKLRIKERESQAVAVQDKVTCLKVIINRVQKLDPKTSDPVDRVCKEIDTIFEDGVSSKCVLLSTIHKSKGREWKNVYFLQAGASKWARMDWEMEQEKNLFYVAVTRAQENLFMVPMPKKGEEK